MQYVGPLFRPPSEAQSLIVQATLGCSWNRCTYCDMYRTKSFEIRDIGDVLKDVSRLPEATRRTTRRVFVADGDALVMPMTDWRYLLDGLHRILPNLERVSAYAMARNILDKTEAELRELRASGVSMLYVGPESGDDVTLKRIAKGDDAKAHVDAAALAHRADIQLSVIALLGIGRERMREHAEATGRLVSAMNPRYFSALTVTVVPGTPLEKEARRGRFEVPPVLSLLEELQWMLKATEVTDTTFRTNHASNYLPLAGRLPDDKDRLLEILDAALAGQIALRPDWMRAL